MFVRVVMNCGICFDVFVYMFVSIYVYICVFMYVNL